MRTSSGLARDAEASTRMPIQFHCPYCTATIRVADAAGGKQGSCPKCGTKVIVPLVGPAAESSQPNENAPLIRDSIPLPPDLETHDVGGTPAIADAAKQWARRKSPAHLVPILLFGVVMLLVLYAVWKPNASLKGQLTAERITGFTIPPGRIDKTAFGLPPDEVDQILADMKGNPPAMVRVPDWFEMRFQPVDAGFEVVIRKTIATEIFKVQANSSLRRFLRRFEKDLIKRRQVEFDSAAKEFIEAWKKSQSKGAPLEMEAFRSSLGFNRLTGSAGYCLVAQIGGRNYRAVHEDDDGNLYFLLPRRTASFFLQAREFSDGTIPFSGRLKVVLRNPAARQPAESAESPESESSGENSSRSD